MTTDYPIGARVAAGDTTPTSAALNALLEERDTAVTDLRDAIDELAALHVQHDAMLEQLRRVQLAYLTAGGLWDDTVRELEQAVDRAARMLEQTAPQWSVADTHVTPDEGMTFPVVTAPVWLRRVLERAASNRDRARAGHPAYAPATTPNT